jgi:hypothetical protein
MNQHCLGKEKLQINYETGKLCSKFLFGNIKLTTVRDEISYCWRYHDFDHVCTSTKDRAFSTSCIGS